MTAILGGGFPSTATQNFDQKSTFIHVKSGKAEIGLNLFQLIPCLLNMQQQQFWEGENP